MTQSDCSSSRPFYDEAHFIAAVKLGEADFDHGDILTHEEIGAHIMRLRGAGSISSGVASAC